MSECIVCDSEKFDPLYQGIIKCHDCSYIMADCNLSDEELKSLYSENYFHGEEYSNYSEEKEIIQTNFKLRVNSLKKVLDLTTSKVLEIGSAYGFFLDSIKGEVKSAEGIDITEDGISHAKNELGLNAQCGDFLKTDFNSKTFDLVCMWDTIEHLPTPHLFVEKAASLINQGGHIAITTGDIDSLNAKFRKENWRLIHPPTHLHYFSKKTLTKLLEKNGFEVVHFEYAGFYRSLDLIFYAIFVLKLKWNFMYKLLKAFRLNRINLYANLYDIMYIIARKK